MIHRQVCIVQAPVILSQGDLQDKVAEVLEAVKKDQSAAGAAAAALPQIVLVSSASKALSSSFVIPCPLTQNTAFWVTDTQFSRRLPAALTGASRSKVIGLQSMAILV